MMGFAKVKLHETACMAQCKLVERQVEFENESAMLGLSPKSRRDLLMAAEILKQYGESLDPVNSPYDRMQLEQYTKVLSEFHKVIKETSVEIVEKNVPEVKPATEIPHSEQI